ncbi:MAG: M56 family metallopeptidase, partial [Candidatus Binatia bacterium]
METISNWFMFLLVNSIWQITAIALVSLLCDRLLRAMPARVRHSLWVAALVLAVASPLLSGIDLNTLLTSDTAAAFSTDVEAPTTQATSSAIDENTRTAQPFIRVSQTFALSLLAAYLLLLGYRTLRLIGAFRKTRKMRQSSFAGNWSESHAKIIGECKIACGVKNVEIRCSSQVPSPATFGARRPTIVLPDSLLNEPDPNILTTAVSHELNHVRRHDYILNLLYELI